MVVVLIIVGAAIVSSVAWAMTRSPQRPRSGAHNNWQNEDYLSRAAARSWAEGATYSKSEPKDGTGLGM